MFIAALEFRKYLQRERSESERKMKLMELADKWLKRKDCPFSKDTPKEVVAEDIEDSYNKGTDLLDPEMFWKEDLIAFAEENKITNDPMMKDFINRAYVSA